MNPVEFHENFGYATDKIEFLKRAVRGEYKRFAGEEEDADKIIKILSGGLIKRTEVQVNPIFNSPNGTR